MADKHPYTSGSGGLIQTVTQLRKSFPTIVSADTLKKLEIAPFNETYVLNILRFIGVLDAENKKIDDSGKIFNKHEDAEFQQDFSKLVERAYKELFALHGEGAWSLPLNKLISFFRTHDSTSDVVGKRQATTFQTLASLSGKTTSTPAPAATKSAGNGSKIAKSVKPAKATLPKTNVPASPSATQPKDNDDKGSPSPIALTVRVEINLPAGGDQKTYDAIFKSIRENLLNGHGV